MNNPRFQRLAGFGALGVAVPLLALYALLAYISTPSATGGIDWTNATIVYIGVGMVVLALIAVHVVLGRQLLAGARDQEIRLAELGVAPGAALAAAGGTTDEHDGSHAAHEEGHGHHPTARTYIIVGAFLTLITAVEVWVYYIPAFVASAAFVPSLLVMSAVKFATVVMVYMHLKYDHKLFRALFTGPFLIAFTTLFALMFLFGKLAIRLGVLS